MVEPAMRLEFALEEGKVGLPRLELGTKGL
jgi:hypothetical protein